MKSSIEEIQHRFDHDVDRFSSLETGQTSTVDAALVLNLIASAAALTSPTATAVLDLGCGAGNFSLKLLEHLPNLTCTLVDLSRPMLDRAQLRIGVSKTIAIQGDLRTLDFGQEQFDIILAAAVLHHLRTGAEWRDVSAKLYAALRPGGTIWIFDLVSHEIPPLQALLSAKYGEYLSDLKDTSYRDHVFAYVEREDSPIPVTQMCELLRAAGFSEIDILHKNTCFAALGARKAMLHVDDAGPVGI